jgi:hypothetical protein
LVELLVLSHLLVVLLLLQAEVLFPLLAVEV